MNGIEFLRGLSADEPMPMAKPFSLRIVEVERGHVLVEAQPSTQHTNPFDVVQGGFAATVLDIALGLVSISVLEGSEASVATTDLSVRYVRSIAPGEETVRGTASIVHRGRTTIVAEARLVDAHGRLLATAQCTSLIGLEAVRD